ncbi:HEPN domain-containing protein [Sutcliffiella cohnii]|nr:HEPN domain-containing protein [Sutcliffiella cohnii]
MEKQKNELEFGMWKIGKSDFELKGILHLSYESNQFYLELYSDVNISLPHYTDVVYGKTHKGKEFTLYDCSIRGGTSISYAHDYKSKYIFKVHCSYILEGKVFTSDEEIKLKSVNFHLTNFNKWAFQQSIVEVETNDSDGYVIRTKKLEDFIHNNDEFQLSISYVTIPDNENKITTTFNIETFTKITMKFKNPTSLERAHSLIYQFRDFISLCTNLRTYIKYISAVPYFTEERGLDYPIQIYGQVIEFEKKEKISELTKFDEFISLDQIKDNFNICMSNWFQKNEKLKPVIDLYFSTKYHKTSNERHFLNLVQALEAYHRLTKENKVLPYDEHKTKIENILSNVPPEHKDWLKSRLAFSNEPNLHDRLDELLTPKSKSESPYYAARYQNLFILHGKSKLELIRDIKNTRNYNTHFDERLITKALKGEELYQLIALLKSMMEYYLLMELEIDEDLVLDFIWKKVKDIHLRNELIGYYEKNNIKFF